MSRTPAVPSAACPCGRLQGSGAKAKPPAYADCCGRFIDHWDTQPAPDAECLMRSRYTAFVQGRADYLLATWHPSHRPASLDFDAAAQWLGLEVRGHWVKDADHAEVEFVARHRLGGRAVRLHERSRFVREGGRWYYVDGDMPPVR
ncbi:MAG: YchJ family protein [Acidovorax temperans]|uniref:YchJ family protein n=1 Tax=Acidovorax temperans TaxID=80878 RepID=UPI00391A4C77